MIGCRRMATATYPPPPPYYRLYKDYSESPSSALEPPSPIEGTYVCFGGNFTVIFSPFAFSLIKVSNFMSFSLYFFFFFADGGCSSKLRRARSASALSQRL